ncbi:alginate lyase family protein [Persicitalea sp.]|uniref:alginate lyase family protein n=1 Tax=Persicitalea sp. TaxID=3100273 RepID=UPI003593F701
MKLSSLFLFLFFLPRLTQAEIPETLLLTPPQQKYLRQLIQTNPDAKALWLKAEREAKGYLNDQPRPLKVIHYEGLLDTNPNRIDTEKSLRDMDKLAAWLFAYYATQDEAYAKNAKEYIVAWANTYQPTGNPINENKFEPLIHSYQTLRKYFSPDERERVQTWLSKIAAAEIAYPHMPQNNWKTKQIKLVGTIGLIVGREDFERYAVEDLKKYIDHALYDDGETFDLRQRDAMGYHVSGLKPLLVIAITMDQFRNDKGGIKIFDYQNPAGGSIRKSVDYVVPYALGEKVHEEWVNTKVELDRQRAAAGLAHYQPGVPYEAERSRELFELASYFDPEYQKVLRHLAGGGNQEFDSWFAMLITAVRSGKNEPGSKN